MFCWPVSAICSPCHPPGTPEQPHRQESWRSLGHLVNSMHGLNGQKVCWREKQWLTPHGFRSGLCLPCSDGTTSSSWSQPPERDLEKATISALEDEDPHENRFRVEHTSFQMTLLTPARPRHRRGFGKFDKGTLEHGPTGILHPTWPSLRELQWDSLPVPSPGLKSTWIFLLAFRRLCYLYKNMPC